jgi:hypothetical protein
LVKILHPELGVFYAQDTVREAIIKRNENKPNRIILWRDALARWKPIRIGPDEDQYKVVRGLQEGGYEGLARMAWPKLNYE